LYTSFLTHPAPIYRFFLKRFSRKYPKACLATIRSMVHILFPIHWALWKIHPRLNWLLNRVSPMINYFSVLPDLDRQGHKEWSILDTHDSLADWYKHRRTKEQIERYLKKLNLVEVEASYNGNGVEARSQRPR